MKIFIREYRLLNQKFFFKDTLPGLIILLLLLPLLSKWVGIESEILAFSILSLLMVEDLSNKKFPLLTCMPVRAHAIVNVLYANILIFSLFGVSLCHIIYTLNHIYRPLFMSFIIYILSVTLANLICMIVTSSEFKDAPSVQSNKIPLFFVVSFVVTAIIYQTNAYDLVYRLSYSIDLNTKWIIGTLLSLLTVLNLIGSYKYVKHKVYD